MKRFNFKNLRRYILIGAIVANASSELLKPDSNVPQDPPQNDVILTGFSGSATSVLGSPATNIGARWLATELRSTSMLNDDGNSRSHYEVPFTK